MIPGAFSYHRPANLADAVKLLSDLGEDARPLAGGHSLVPMMKLRLASPAHLVDLHGIAGLKGIRRDGNSLVIGAMTTQHELLVSEEIGADYLALLASYDVQFVLMTAGPDCLEERCVMRGYQPGFGRWSLIAAGHLPHGYDLTLDSEQVMTQECAATVAASWGLADAACAAADLGPGPCQHPREQDRLVAQGLDRCGCGRPDDGVDSRLTFPGLARTGENSRRVPAPVRACDDTYLVAHYSHEAAALGGDVGRCRKRGGQAMLS